jgi:Arc/MetJ-type ribon-helix-helix transcriptional regulator
MPTRDRYKKRRADRSTYSFHLERGSVAGVQTLVDREVFENRSHAVDEALRLLLDLYRDRLDATDDREPAHAA